MITWFKNIKLITFALLIFCLGFAFSRAYSIVSVPEEVDEQKEDLELFWRVWNTLEGKYPFEEPSTTDKFYGAIEGLAKAYGDDHTSFLAPVEATYFNEVVSGEFGGIGAEVNLVKGLLTIVTPLEGSPAQKAGLEPGDIITKIDDQSIVGMTLTGATALIRGKTGTKVVLDVVRDDIEKPLKITITRAIVTIPIIETKTIDDVFVISLFSFNEMSQKEFKKAIETFEKSKKKKLILDLRSNPGGYLEAANDIASYFLPQGKVIVREDFGTKRTEQILYRSAGHTLLSNKDFDMVILVDGGSASASEIVAAALKDHHIATIVGETTFGKGSVQELIQLPKGAALKVTIAKWLSPKGTVIDKEGVTPDVVVQDDYATPEDEQLLKAIESLN